jgi:hypothetical protein
MSRGFAIVCSVLVIHLACHAQSGLAAIANITSVAVTTGDGGAPPFDLQAVTVGAYTITKADFRTGTTEALPGGNDGGTFFNTWPDQVNTTAPSSNLDINDILARNNNPNPILFKAFGGITQWFDTNGNNPDFFMFEAASGTFGDPSPSVQAILPGGGLGLPVELPDTGMWGDTGLTRVGNPNGGQNLTGISFAVTDLLDAAGSPLTNTSIIEGIQVNSMGLDPSTLAAVMIGIEPLGIEVNTSTGNIKIVNGNAVWPVTESMSFYRIESPSGSLSLAGWNSLDGQNVGATGGGGLGDGWDASGGSSAAGISELRLEGSTALAPGEDLDLGNAFRAGLSADFNNSGTTNGADLAAWASTFGGAANATNGDANGDNRADGDDFLIWQRDFNSTGGSGQQDLTFTYLTPGGVEVEGLVSYVSGAGASAGAATGVPEPAALGLMALAGLFLMRQARHRVARYALCAAALSLLGGGEQAPAALVHKYNFNDNTANDSVGTAHGTIVDPAGIGFFTAGQYSLTNNNGALSGQDFTLPATMGTYVNLPNGIFSNAAIGGTRGQISLEFWFTTETNRSSTRLADFGRQNDGDGEDEPTGGANAQSYVAFQPQAGNDVLLQMRKGDPAVDYRVAATPALPTNLQHHVAIVLDDTDFAEFIDGRASMYVNGALAATNSLPIFSFLDQVSDLNNWLGRSQFNNNPLFDGRINEVRIHDTALSAADVTNSFTLGPDPGPPGAELTVDRSTGNISITNSTSGPVQISGYSITSAAGALSPSGFTSIDAANSFDPNGTWVKTSMTNQSLAESESPAGDGGAVTVGSSHPIGNAWLQTPVTDLVFQYSVQGGGVETGIVNYVGTPIARSDLNGSGTISIEDWGIFVANNYADLSALSPAEAYLSGDLDGDLDNDKDDYLLFRSDYIAANGEAAFAALLGAVPEPATAMLGALALLPLARRRRT